MNTNADIHTLTGAYALNALTDGEQQAFERHLAECEVCAREVRELQETSALLGAAATASPPTHLKQRVLSQIAGVRQLPPLPQLPEPQQALQHHEPARSVPWFRRWSLRLPALAAAACLVVVVVLGVQLVHVNRQSEQTRAQLAEVTAVLTAQDTRVVTGRGANGGTGTAVVSRTHNKAVFLAEGLPQLPSTSTYQLWLIGPGGPRSAGLLSPARESTTPLIARDVRDANNVGVTIEPSGGSQKPTTTPVLLLTLAG